MINLSYYKDLNVLTLVVLLHNFFSTSDSKNKVEIQNQHQKQIYNKPKKRKFRKIKFSIGSSILIENYHLFFCFNCLLISYRLRKKLIIWDKKTDNIEFLILKISKLFGLRGIYSMLNNCVV